MMRLCREAGDWVRGSAKAGVLLALLASACGTEGGRSAEEVGLRAARQAIGSTEARVLGFESSADWSSGAGTLSASDSPSEGAHALAVVPHGWTEVDSIALQSLGSVKDTFSFDLRLPESVGWGEARAILISPSRGMWWTELGSRSLSTFAAGHYETISFSIPSEVKSALEGTYSDLRVKLVINAPTLASPYLVDNIDVADIGASPNEESEQQELSLSTPEGVSLDDALVSATGHLSIFSQAKLGAPGDTPAVANFGTQQSYLQAEAGTEADLYSVGNVKLDAKSRVGGACRTQGIIEKQGVGTSDAPVIVGGEFPGASGPEVKHRWKITWPSDNQGDVLLPAAPAGQNLETTLAPGVYGQLNIHDRNTVVLHGGVYYFESFNTEPLASIRLERTDESEPVFIYVHSSFVYKGGFVDGGAALGQTLVGYTGSSDAFLQAPFTGTLVAPNATIRLERPTSGAHRGSFFGKGVEVAAGQHTVQHLPFRGWNALLNPDTSDNAPTPPVRARWVRADGQPVYSFSYAPLPSAAPQALRNFVQVAPPALPSGTLSHGASSGGPTSPFSGWTLEPGSEGGPSASSEGGEEETESQSFSLLRAIEPPSELPQQTLWIDIENTSTDALGVNSAYSVMVRSWGLGNFYADSLVVPASSNTVIAPSQTKRETINLLNHLWIRTPQMTAKADFAVGLHRVLASGQIEEEPYAFVGIPSFYYNFTADQSGVYTYGLERPPAGSAPTGYTEVDGVVERYENGTLGGNMFEPEGFLGTVPAADARAAHLEQFADRGHAVFGVRPSTHDVTATGDLVQPIEPPIPPQGSGGYNDPYDPATGLTTFCWRWPVSYLDKGKEAYPAVIAEAEWHGLVDFIPASFAFADLYRADGSKAAEGQLDANGCLPPQELGKGNYYFRIFTAKIETGNVHFQVRGAEPIDQPAVAPFFDVPTRALSLTASVYLHDPGRAFAIQTGFWTNTTNIAGIASHALRRHFGGVDLGLLPNTPKPYLMLVDSLHCTKVNAMDSSKCDKHALEVSHFSPTNGIFFINPHTDVWTHDARWKFVAGHEFGHQVQDFAGAGLNARYTFTSGTDQSDVNGTQDDPKTALGITGCSCDVVDADNASHCLQSIELSEPAQQEGFGHFFASRLWNRVPGEEGYEAGKCNFTYYKQVSAPELVSGQTLFPVFVDCGHAYKHRDDLCGDVHITDTAGVPLSAGSELDWLTFYWDVTTSSASGTPVADLLSWYKTAIATVQAETPGKLRRPLTLADLDTAAPIDLSGKADAHAVD